MINKVRIGLLMPLLAPMHAYEQEALNLNLDLVIVTPTRIHWATGQVSGLVWDGQSWTPQTVPIPRGIYNRYYGAKPKIVNRIENIIGKDKIFNHITRFDKWELHQILSQSSLQSFIPETTLYTSEKLSTFLEQFNYVILKPKLGHFGSKVYLVGKDKDGYHLHQGSKYPFFSCLTLNELLTKIQHLVTDEFLIQQFIPLATLGERIFDLRCLVQKDSVGTWRVTGVLARIALQYSYITNASKYITDGQETLEKAFPKQNLLPKLKQISIKGAQIAEKTLGSLGELSVDLGIDVHGKIWIIELNAKPMKSIFTDLDDQKTLARIYQSPLLYARHLATT